MLGTLIRIKKMPILCGRHNFFDEIQPIQINLSNLQGKPLHCVSQLKQKSEYSSNFELCFHLHLKSLSLKIVSIFFPGVDKINSDISH